jgi:hypothetical protein
MVDSFRSRRLARPRAADYILANAARPMDDDDSDSD